MPDDLLDCARAQVARGSWLGRGSPRGGNVSIPALLVPKLTHTMLPEHTQRYRPVGTQLFGTRPPEWEVIGTFTGCDGIEYARLRRVGPLPEEKTIAADVLADRRHYQPV
ncbi:MAG TPA: hypothetical protein VF342_07365 [Alphaproteobacteria bacterium]